MSAYLTVELRQQLLEADDQRCAYCQTTQANSGYPVVVDHIIPRSKGGKTDFANLCFACYRCNEFKGSATVLEDPLSNEMTSLFHPRRQTWSEHFTWDVTGVRIVGLMAVGRVTVIALNMNNEVIHEQRGHYGCAAELGECGLASASTVKWPRAWSGEDGVRSCSNTGRGTVKTEARGP